MKVIYLSNHGFGHIIRSIPIMEKMSQKEVVYVACGKEQIIFLKQYFATKLDCFIFHIIQTDVGLINYKNGLKVNKSKTQIAIFQYMKILPSLVDEEVQYLKNKDVSEIYVDISPLGILVGKTLKTKVYLMTNFTWYKQYLHLNFDAKIIRFYYELDKMVDEIWLYPLSFPFTYLHCLKRKVDFISRPIDETKIKELKDKYPQIISVLSGMSSQLLVEITNYQGLVITTDKVHIKYNGPLVVLGPECLDSQNYIASSDLVVTKAGFTTILECMNAKVRMLLIERPSAYEDSFLIEEVKRRELGTAIKEVELRKLDIGKYLTGTVNN